METNEFDYAPIGKRFLALLLDGIIIIIPAAALSFLCHFLGPFLVAILYEPVFLSSAARATPGKRIMGISVLDEAGQRLRFKAAMIRFCVKWVSGAVILIGYLVALFTPRKQAFHDLVADTVVVTGNSGYDMWESWLDQLKSLLSKGLSRIQTPTSGQPTQKATYHEDAAHHMSTLDQLYELYKKGAISEAEYAEKKKEILEKIK